MKRRICFVAPPFSGHLNPMAALARAALDAGYDVEVLTGAAKVETLRAAGLPASSLTSFSAGALEAIADTPRQVGADPLALSKQMRAAFNIMGGAKEELIARWRATRPDLVVADFIAVPAGLAADTLNVPWITILRAAFSLEGRRGPPSYLGGLRPMPGLLGAARDRAGWLAVRMGKDALAALFARDMQRLGLRRRRPDGAEAMYSPYRILALEPEELEFDRDWPSTLSFIGPLVQNPEPALDLRLPAERPRVLVTFGTHLPWAKASLVEAVRGLADRLPEVTFVVSLGRPTQAESAPTKVSERVFVYNFVSYSRCVPGMDAVIHHGGAGVTGACIAAGKPVLVTPQDYDQFDYAARIEHHGLGERVGAINSAATAAALRRILNQDLPALARFKRYVDRYDPIASFLLEVEAILAERCAQS